MLDEAVFTAGDLMTRDVAVVHPETSLREAVKIMAERKISGMPVVDDAGSVLGVISEGDLIRWHEGYTDRQARWLDLLAEGTDLSPIFLEGLHEQHRKVKSVMTTEVKTVTEDMLARDIARLMYSHNIKRVPVMRDGKLIGIVARSDLIGALAQKLDEKPIASPSPIGTVNDALRRGRGKTAT